MSVKEAVRERDKDKQPIHDAKPVESGSQRRGSEEVSSPYIFFVFKLHHQSSI